nr:40S ribosomal protein S28 [Ipomoea batatas]
MVPHSDGYSTCLANFPLLPLLRFVHFDGNSCSSVTLHQGKGFALRWLFHRMSSFLFNCGNPKVFYRFSCSHERTHAPPIETHASAIPSVPRSSGCSTERAITYNIRINWACRMESQIKHAIVVKVMGRTGSRGQVTQA